MIWAGAFVVLGGMGLPARRVKGLSGIWSSGTLKRKARKIMCGVTSMYLCDLFKEIFFHIFLVAVGLQKSVYFNALSDNSGIHLWLQ